MVKLEGTLMPNNSTNLIDPVMTVCNNIDKIQNLARKVSDDKINMEADLCKLFKRSTDKGFRTNANKQ